MRKLAEVEVPAVIKGRTMINCAYDQALGSICLPSTQCAMYLQ